MGRGLRDLEIQAQACVQQLHPATSELRSVFAGYVCTCGTCVLRVDSCSCVQMEHACPTLCWKLWSSWNATVLFVCDVAQCNIWQVYVPELNSGHLMNSDELYTDKICIQNLLLYTEHVFWLKFLAYYLYNWLTWGRWNVTGRFIGRSPWFCPWC